MQTFFSPSGYEVRKDYKGADVVCYLPLDSPRNVKKFIDLAHPYMAFFIKYEFWCNYLSELKRRIFRYIVFLLSFVLSRFSSAGMEEVIRMS